MKKRLIRGMAVGLLLLAGLAAHGPGDGAKVLIGAWQGIATGPGGGPPTGEITMTFSDAGDGTLAGNVDVKTSEGLKYSGAMENIMLQRTKFSAAVLFRLGETPLEADLSGDLVGKSIEGTFTVMMKGQEMGGGTFRVTKEKSAGKAPR